MCGLWPRGTGERNKGRKTQLEEKKPQTKIIIKNRQRTCVMLVIRAKMCLWILTLNDPCYSFAYTGCWETSHVALSFSSPLPSSLASCVFMPLLHTINVWLLSSLVSLCTPSPRQTCHSRLQLLPERSDISVRYCFLFKGSSAFPPSPIVTHIVKDHLFIYQQWSGKHCSSIWKS